MPAALALVASGHHVLPLHTPTNGGCSCRRSCGSIGKHPRGGFGLTHASNDPGTVASWWITWPLANLGLRCDGLLALDVDGQTGEQSLEHLESELGRLPATRTQRTGSGRHLLFRAHVDSNSTRGLGSPPGIDVRGGDRGYIVCAPSMHASGNRYSWSDERPAVELPDRWLEQLVQVPARADPIPTGITTATTTVTTGYGRAALRSELERLLGAPEGHRNEQLNRRVFRLAQLVAGGELPRECVERQAYEFALLIGLGPEESRNTIDSALRAGIREPRRRG
jgi:Bifunctional DNA primase/polymerase, N-terminal